MFHGGLLHIWDLDEVLAKSVCHQDFTISVALLSQDADTA